MHFGDPDQAIYGSIKSEANKWVPGKGYLSISNSNRYGQEIANKLSFLRTNRQEIIASRGFIGHKPILIIYNDESIHSVITEYLAQLYKNGLCDPNGIYTVIGHIKNPGTAGKTIGSYWSNFVGTKNRKNIEKYWDYVDKICESLKDGKIYNTEPVIRELFLKIFQYAKVNLKDRKIITMRSFRKYLNENYYDIYRNGIMRLVLLQDINRCSVNETIQLLLSDIFGDLERIRIMNSLPKYFMEYPEQEYDDNILTDPEGKLKIRFDTVHGVKGQTHDATLYLETEYKKGSDIKRILPFMGVGKAHTSPLYDYSRKMVYVGMSRPKTLLCVAIQESTYNIGKEAFQDWDIVDLRERCIDN